MQCGVVAGHAAGHRRIGVSGRLLVAEPVIAFHVERLAGGVLRIAGRAVARRQRDVLAGRRLEGQEAVVLGPVLESGGHRVDRVVACRATRVLDRGNDEVARSANRALRQRGDVGREKLVGEGEDAMAIAVGRCRREAVQPGVRRQHAGVLAHSADLSRERRLPPFAVVGGIRECALHRCAEVMRQHAVDDRIVALDDIGPWAVSVDDELHQFDRLRLHRRVEARRVGLSKAREGREVGGDQSAVAARDDAQREELRHSGFVEEAVERGALHESADRLAQRVGAARGCGRFRTRRVAAGEQHGSSGRESASAW